MDQAGITKGTYCSSLSINAFSRQILEVGAVCVSSAHTDLCGGAPGDRCSYRDRTKAVYREIERLNVRTESGVTSDQIIQLSSKHALERRAP